MSDADTRRLDRLSPNKIEIIHNRQNKKCIYCNRPIDIKLQRGIHWNVEHVIPRAIFKWLENILPKKDNDKLFKLITSMDNLALVHYKCNIRKDSYIPSEKELKELKVSTNVINKYIDTLNKTNEYIQQYYDIKNRVYSKQKCKCFICKKRTTFKSAVIRRKDSNIPRIESNAMVICTQCNSELHISKYKKRVDKRFI
ncbi:MAG: hypothetical protein J6A59_11685 [Lachnospiraceae bacterium]|nr:hypothetical protein [Lachnospiraceae bacterium]